MTETIVTQNTPTVPTFLQWTADASGALHLAPEPQIPCPACETYCGHLIDGVCLGCLVEWDEAIAAAEARYDAAAETCCSCGID